MLIGKTAFITGASKGIGKAIAEVYAQNKADLILHARNKSDLDSIATGLRETYHINVITTAFDLTKINEIKSALKILFKEIKSIDILVNNAGILEGSLIGMISAETIEKTYSTNVYSVYEISQYIARIMQRKNTGSIINITSIMGNNGAEGQSVYSGSKAAVIGITKSMSKELAKDNIRVNAIAPGFIDTDMTKSLSPFQYKEKLELIKMGRPGKAIDVAHTALYLGSDLSTYVTGQVIGVDGGMLI